LVPLTRYQYFRLFKPVSAIAEFASTLNATELNSHFSANVPTQQSSAMKLDWQVHRHGPLHRTIMCKTQRPIASCRQQHSHLSFCGLLEVRAAHG
jgi:hypothetical protein